MLLSLLLPTKGELTKKKLPILGSFLVEELVFRYFDSSLFVIKPNSPFINRRDHFSYDDHKGQTDNTKAKLCKPSHLVAAENINHYTKEDGVENAGKTKECKEYTGDSAKVFGTESLRKNKGVEGKVNTADESCNDTASSNEHWICCTTKKNDPKNTNKAQSIEDGSNSGDAKTIAESAGTNNIRKGKEGDHRAETRSGKDIHTVPLPINRSVNTQAGTEKRKREHSNDEEPVEKGFLSIFCVNGRLFNSILDPCIFLVFKEFVISKHLLTNSLRGVIYKDGRTEAGYKNNASNNEVCGTPFKCGQKLTNKKHNYSGCAGDRCHHNRRSGLSAGIKPFCNTSRGEGLHTDRYCKTTDETCNIKHG